MVFSYTTHKHTIHIITINNYRQLFPARDNVSTNDLIAKIYRLQEVNSVLPRDLMTTTMPGQQ